MESTIVWHKLSEKRPEEIELEKIDEYILLVSGWRDCDYELAYYKKSYFDDGWHFWINDGGLVDDDRIILWAKMPEDLREQKEV